LILSRIVLTLRGPPSLSLRGAAPFLSLREKRSNLKALPPSATHAWIYTNLCHCEEPKATRQSPPDVDHAPNEITTLPLAMTLEFVPVQA
jgi:hypothetical protein